MSDTKILQLILDGHVTIRKDIKEVEKKVDNLEKVLVTRMDKLGSQLAFLEDDAPTRDEHDKLEKRVSKVERKLQIQAS